MRIMLERLGWQADDDIIWNKRLDVIRMLPVRSIYCRIMLLLKERPATRSEIEAELHIGYGNISGR